MSTEHSWVRHEREGWTVCVRCGLVRNYDRPASQCRGAARIALREATGGEQGPSADEAEIAKLRRELAEIGGAFSQSEKYREDAHSQLAVIVDEAFGPQEVLPLPNLLSRLERLLTERARQHEEVRRERDAARADANRHLVVLDELRSELWRTRDRCRAAAQILIAEIGASGPENIEETARRAVERIKDLKCAAENLSDACDNCDPAIEIERLAGALRDLIASADASMTRDTSVLCDIDAARAVLGGRS